MPKQQSHEDGHEEGIHFQVGVKWKEKEDELGGVPPHAEAGLVSEVYDAEASLGEIAHGGGGAAGHVLEQLEVALTIIPELR